MALATMAIVCVLSVFNGFRSLVADRDSQLAPDLLVESVSAPVITNADSLAAEIRKLPGVAEATPVVSDNAVAYRMNQQLPVNILGVDPQKFAAVTGVGNMLVRGKFIDAQAASAQVDVDENEEVEAAEGEFSEDALFADVGIADSGEDQAEIPPSQAVLSVGSASQLGFSATASPEEMEAEGVVLFMPRRTASSFSQANPAASFMIDSLAVSGLVESEQSEFDANTIIIDLAEARSLLEYDSQASYIYVKQAGKQPLSADKLSEKLGPDYLVKDRLQQQTLHMRMISIEKWITYLLLSFILIIASFNIISTLSMLVIDKRNDIVTLSRMGAPKSMISSVFCWESGYVCAAGTIFGALLGVILCLIQQHFGLIKIGGDSARLIVTSYPVEVQPLDLALILIPSLLIALLTAVTASRFARRQLSAR